MAEHVSTRIVDFLRKNKNKWFTRKQVGEGVGLKKTPYLADALDTLAEGGFIGKELGTWGGFSCWYYGIDNTVLQQRQLWEDDGESAGEVVSNG